MKLEPYLCPQCGGKVNRSSLICEHCGTQFKEKTDIIKIVAEQPGVHTLSASYAIPKEYIYQIGAEEAAKMALNEIARKMANCIMPFIKVRTDNEIFIEQNEMYVRGDLRVLDPIERKNH